MSKILFIGVGASGMMASVFAAQKVHEFHIFEKNEKTGKKLYITGKGRCNLTNACDMDTLFASVCTNEKFLYSAFYGFTNEDVMNFFEKAGVALKAERGGRVFPASDRAADVLDALRRCMKKSGVQVHLHSEVTDILIEEKYLRKIRPSDGYAIMEDAESTAPDASTYASNS